MFHKHKKFILYVVTLTIIVLNMTALNNSYYRNFTKGEPCVTDALMNIIWGRNMLVILTLISIVYIIMQRDEYCISRIIQRKSKKAFWQEKVFEIIKIALFYGVGILILTVVIGFIMTKGILYNWDSANSLFRGLYDVVLSSNRLIIVGIVAFLILVLQIIFVLVADLIAFWVINTYIITEIMIIAVAVNDSREDWIPFFFSRFSVMKSQWGGSIAHMAAMIVVWIVLDMVLIIAGYLYAERKEFLNAKDIAG